MTTDSARNTTPAILIFAVLTTSFCAIVYELLISTLSSYLFGSSVLHFSLTIGLFMSFMGVGSYASKFIEEKLLDWFIGIEILIGLLGGFSGLLLYGSYSLTEYYYALAFCLIAAISIGVGMEVPLITRIIRENSRLKDALANVLAVDYAGALIASVFFPLILLPYLGVLRTAFAVGVLHLAVAAYTAFVLKEQLAHRKQHLLFSALSSLALVLGFVYSISLVGVLEQFLYQDQIVHSQQSRYQKIVLTRHKSDTRLFLDGNLQFSSLDEYRYHETLVHLPLNLVPHAENVLLLGAGDGLAVRELLKYASIKRITVVDLDPAITELARENAFLRELNGDSLRDPRVEIINEDAFEFISSNQDLYSVIIADLPDPNTLSLGKLYSKEFYFLLRKRLANDGAFITQATSPYFAREPYWCIHQTIEAVFPNVEAAQLYVPSFGIWGFHLAMNREFSFPEGKLKVPTRWLSLELLPAMTKFDADMAEVPTTLNRLDNQSLVQYYEASWADWN